MSNNAPAATADRINHVKVVVLALIASLAIMTVGITARATDDMNGYGLVQINNNVTGSTSGIVTTR